MHRSISPETHASMRTEYLDLSPHDDGSLKQPELERGLKRVVSIL